MTGFTCPGCQQALATWDEMKRHQRRHWLRANPLRIFQVPVNYARYGLGVMRERMR